MTPEAMAALHHASFTLPRPWSAAEFARLSDSPAVFVASESFGFAMGRIAADEVELLTLAVAPAARRQGVGARLLATLLEKARTRGASRVFLEVAADNTAAVGLYLQAGFSVCGRRHGYYPRPDGPPTDALVMVRSL